MAAFPLYPLINGFRFQWASAEIVLNDVPYQGIKTLNYSDTNEEGQIFGTSRQMLGRTGGQYKAEASIEMFKEESTVLLAAIAAIGAGGYMDGVFNILAQYQEPNGFGIVTDLVVGCRIKKIEDSHQEGTDALTVKLDLSPMYLIRNGVTPLNLAAMLK